ncbi:helix-turn-helix domain-containing protein [Aquabacter cavernae]|uniref:helix-turn-helix domain-containing protein n=1 Tax=Aquabacter cavernae TaxID=2496029 RepID=UPI000F8EA732|nr:helix-turn-helix transcriptional regulator [Aquabacter cavernae]
MPPHRKKPSRDAGSLDPNLPLSAAAADFAHRLKTWRRLNGIKQVALANMLGVSQSAVSFWETGRDMPGPVQMSQINDLIAASTRDELAMEKAFTRRQGSVRALYDFDGAVLLTASAGFQALWPRYASLEGQSMRDHLVNEVQTLATDTTLYQDIVKGELGIVSGVSDRMTDLELDPAVRHRWHMCFRHSGYHTIIEIAYEPTTLDVSTGITDLIYLDGSAGPKRD